MASRIKSWGLVYRASSRWFTNGALSIGVSAGGMETFASVVIWSPYPTT